MIILTNILLHERKKQTKMDEWVKVQKWNL